MDQQIQLVLFSNDINDQKNGISGDLESLLQIIRDEPAISLTIIETDHSDYSAVNYRKEGNTSIISVPMPEIKAQLSSTHSLPLIYYARRVADILYADLQNKQHVLFWANSADYVWLFEALKEQHKDARFIYVHHHWGWKQYLNVTDNEFAERWQLGDTTLAPKAFERTAYEQKMALISDKVITVSDNDSCFFSDVLEVPANKVISISKGTACADLNKKATAFLNAIFA